MTETWPTVALLSNLIALAACSSAGDEHFNDSNGRAPTDRADVAAPVTASSDPVATGSGGAPSYDAGAVGGSEADATTAPIADSCAFALDGECDEFGGPCADGTDTTDCRCDNAPNLDNTFESATRLPDITNCEDPPHETIRGALKGGTDIDWFEVSAIGGSCQGQVAGMTVRADTTGEVCMYTECMGTGGMVQCMGGGTPSRLEPGINGCCVGLIDGVATVAPTLLACPGDARIYMSVTSDEPSCSKYQIDYHY